MNEATVTKLMEMRLAAMSEAFRQQMKDSTFGELAFEERFGYWWTPNGHGAKAIVCPA